jgi:hypothetical protein
MDPQTALPSSTVVGDSRYFMVMGIDVAVRTAGIGLGGRLSVAEHIVPPGGRLPLHKLGADTVVIGLQGTITLLYAEHESPLPDSHSAFIPSSVYYGYRNDTRHEARLMVITFSAEQDRFLEEVAHNPRNLRDLRRAGARHNIAFVDNTGSGVPSVIPW